MYLPRKVERMRTCLVPVSFLSFEGEFLDSLNLLYERANAKRTWSMTTFQFQDGCHVKVHEGVLYVLHGVAKSSGTLRVEAVR